MLKTAWLMDTVGNKGAAMEIAAIKVVAPEAAALGDRPGDPGATARPGCPGHAAGPAVRARLRTLQLADGPDEVHLRSLARVELARARSSGSRP